MTDFRDQGPRLGAPSAVLVLILGSVVLSCTQDPASAAPHVDELPRLGHVEELRVGDLDDAVAGFSRIPTLSVSDRGDIYVLDSSAREVRVFSPDGDRLHTLGRPGEGPGEFSLPLDIGLLVDTLWVYDGQAQRITWFGPSGDVLFTTPARWVQIDSGQPGLSLSVFPRYPQPDGLIESGLSVSAAPDREIRPYTYPVVRFDRDGALVDTVRWETAEERSPTFRIGERQRYAPYLGPLPPMEEDVRDGRVIVDWSVSGGPVVGVIEVARMRSGDDTAFVRELRYDPSPVPTEEVLDSLITPVVGLAPALGASEVEVERALRDAVELPTFRPPIRGVHAGEDGASWLQLNTSSSDGAEWVVISGQGSILGIVSLPTGMDIHHSRLPAVWAVDHDDYGVPWLVRLRVE